MSKPIPTSTPLEHDASDLSQHSLTSAEGSPSDSFLRLQKQKPVPAGQRAQGDRALRPSDIALSSSPQRSQIIDPGSSPLAMGGRRPSSPMVGGASPLGGIRSASPRHLSPATSQIFERDVQEPTNAPELSPAIPSHIQTEDHIPAVLEASSLAITDEQLDPDNVEIVMHAQHMPAVVAVAQTTMTDPTQQSQIPIQALAPSLPHPAASSSELAVPAQEPEEGGSTYGTVYGAVDPSDPRRLSFISFADVVHAEHIETGKEPSLVVSPASMAPSMGPPRSPSPMRSPLSDRPPASPPTSGTGSFKGVETSPVRSGPGSMTSGHPGHSGHAIPTSELTIETMRQTLQKTGSNELGTAQPATPI